MRMRMRMLRPSQDIDDVDRVLMMLIIFIVVDDGGGGGGICFKLC